MAPKPTCASTSSGMCPQPIESEVSISSMMFGFTCAALELVMGVGEMSVCAARTGVEIIDDSTSDHTSASRAMPADLLRLGFADCCLATRRPTSGTRASLSAVRRGA